MVGLTRARVLGWNVVEGILIANGLAGAQSVD